MTSIPDWMRPGETTISATCVGNAGGHGWVRRALGVFARLLTELARDDDTARAGLLQAIDARAKVLGLVGLVVVCTLVHSVVALVVCCAACAAMAAASGIAFRRLAGAWLAVPLFSAAIMLPAALNIVTEGQRLLVIWHIPGARLGPWRLPETLAVTDAGLRLAALMVLRVGSCVSLAMILAASTPPARLFRGLSGLGVPKVFVMLLGLMERYLGVLLRAAEEIHLAKISRSIASGSLRQEHAWVAAGMGSLYRRANSLGQAVHMAMISRGYNGEVHLMEEQKWRGRDWAFIAAAAAFGAALLALGR